MRGIRFEPSGLAHVVELPVPKPGVDQAVIKVTSTGVCGSDLSALKGTHLFRVPPLISGHEAGGIVSSVGSAASGFRVGDRVVIDPQKPCGSCRYCKSGKYHLCPSKIMLGVTEWDGSFADYVRVPAYTLIPAPDSIADRYLALAEPLAVAAHAVRQLGDRALDQCLVLGGGTIGSLITRVLSDRGAHVTVCEPRESLMATLKLMGAGGVVPGVANLGSDDHFDSIFVAAGVPALIDAAFEHLSPGGAVVQVAVFKNPALVHVGLLQVREQALLGTAMYQREDFLTALQILDRHPDLPDVIVSRVTGLEEGAEIITEMAKSGPGEILKLIMVP